MAKTELEELNEEEDEFTESTSKLRSLVKGITGFDIMQDENTFKDLYDIIIGIGKEWKNLTDIERASLGEALAGKRMSNGLFAILDNLDTLEKAYETASNAEGSAMREQQRYQESIQYSIDRTRASIEELSNSLINSDLLKFLVDVANGFVNITNEVVKFSGLLGTIGIGVGSFVGFKNFSVFLKQLPELKKAISAIDGLSTNILVDGAEGYISAVKGMTAENALLVLSYKNLSAEEKKEILVKAGIITADQELIGANADLAASNMGLSKTFSILGKKAVASIASILSNPITWVVGAIAGVTFAIKEMNQAVEDGRNKVKELSASFAQTKDDIESYKSKITDLNSTLKDQSSSVEDVVAARKELLKVQDDIIQRFGNEEGVITAVNKAIGGQVDALDSISNIEWQKLLDQTNNVGFWGDAANWRDGYADQIDRIQHELFNDTFTVSTNDFRISKEQTAAVNRLFAEKGWVLDDVDGLYMQYTGAREKAINDILDVQQQLSAEFGKDLSKQLSKFLTGAYNTYNEVYEQYKDFQDQYVLNNIIFNPNFELSNGAKNNGFLSNILSGLQSEYESFLSATTQETQDAALQTLATHIRTIFANENIPQEVKDYIQRLFPTVLNELYQEESNNGYAQQIKRRSAQRSGGLSSKYEYGVGYVERYDTEWSQKYDDFVQKHNITSTEELELLDAYIERYGDLDLAIKAYSKDVVEQEKVFAGFNDAQSKEIDDFQSKINSLGNTLKSLANGEEIDMTDLIQEFPELAGHADDLDTAIIELANSSLVALKEKLGDAIPPEVIEALKAMTEQVTGIAPKLSEAYGDIHNTYDILHQAMEEFDETTGLDKFTDSTLQSIAGINEHMNSMVAAWHANGVSSQELFNELKKQYQADLENYGQALVKKYNDSESFYESVGMTDVALINKFNEDYNVDIENCKTYNNAKAKIYNDTLGSITNNLKKFYDAEADGVSAELKRIEGLAAQMDERTRYRFLQSQGYYEFMASYNHYKNAVEGLNNNIYKGIEANYTSVSGKLKDNANSAASEYDDLFDFFERRLEIINQSLEKLDASLEEVNGSMSKNILIAGKIGIVQEEIKNYSSALTMYQTKANAELAKLSTDLQDKIKNGAVNITQLIGENGEEVNKTLEEYKKWADKVNDCNQQLITLKETLRDLALDKFNNIAQDYSDQFDILGSSNDIIEKQIALFEEAGQIVGRAFYESQIEVAQKQKAVLEKERAALLNELSSSISNGLIQKGTDEWLEMSKKIQEVDSGILDVDQSVERLQNSLLELNDKVFDRLQNAFSDIGSQLSNIIGMISDIDVSDENGVWSAEGLTQLGAYAEQYELARYNVEKYQEQLDALNDAYSKELYSTTEYIDKLSDLSQKQWDAANSAEDAKKSMIELNKARVELIKQGIQKQIDAYKELIDKQKQALDQEKSIRDYEKEIAEKSKNINKLQNQLNLLANDDSAAANAKRVKLQQELNDAMEDLQETQYDHSIEAQKEALDKQMEDYQDARDKEIEALEEYLKDTNTVFKDSLEVVKANTDVIANQIAEIAKKHGVQISEAISNSWKSGEGAIASYGAALTAGTSSFIQQIQTIELYLTALQDEADFTADKLVDMLSAKADNLLIEFNAARDSENELITATNLLNEALIKTLEGGYDVSGIIGSLQSVSDQVKKTKDDLNGLYKDKDDDQNKDQTPKTETPPIAETPKTNPIEAVSNAVDTATNLAQNAKNVIHNQKEKELNTLNSQFKYPQYFDPYTGKYTDKYDQLDVGARRGDSYANQLEEQINRAIREYNEKRNEILTKYAGYATGAHNLMKSQFAWTQENGRELVLSPSRNAMFTKLNKGDTVLTKEQTDNLFKLSKIDPEDIFGGIKFNGSVTPAVAPVLTIGNVLTVNGNIDDTNVEKMKAVAASAIDKAFKKFSSEIIKR